MRRLLAACGVALLAAGLLAVSRPRGTVPEPAVTATAAPTFAIADPSDRSRVVPSAAYGRIALDDRVDRTRWDVRGLAIPIAGAALPTDPELLPNAPREFRGGWHEGVDFPADAGTEVHAVAAGTVVRIDHDFVDWSVEEKDRALAQAVELGYTPTATLDRIRGRQVWIDHGGGVVSRYAHLSTVADLQLGTTVERGHVVGLVGSSGFPEGGPHLHLEVRTGTSYLGDGLSGDALLTTIAKAFAAP
jgi:murein DD-endopeptidase MepM/ murein hydrolase activator NlpD